MPEKYTRREFSKIAGATATFQLGDDDDEDGILSRIFGDDEESSSNTEGAVYVDVENELESVNPGPNEVFITTDTERIFKPTDDGKWTEFASLGGDSPWVENADGALTPENDQPVNVGKTSVTSDAIRAYGIGGTYTDYKISDYTDIGAALKATHDDALAAGLKVWSVDLPPGQWTATTGFVCELPPDVRGRGNPDPWSAGSVNNTGTIIINDTGGAFITLRGTSNSHESNRINAGMFQGLAIKAAAKGNAVTAVEMDGTTNTNANGSIVRSITFQDFGVYFHGNPGIRGIGSVFDINFHRAVVRQNPADAIVQQSSASATSGAASQYELHACYLFGEGSGNWAANLNSNDVAVVGGTVSDTNGGNGLRCKGSQGGIYGTHIEGSGATGSLGVQIAGSLDGPFDVKPSVVSRWGTGVQLGDGSASKTRNIRFSFKPVKNASEDIKVLAGASRAGVSTPDPNAYTITDNRQSTDGINDWAPLTGQGRSADDLTVLSGAVVNQVGFHDGTDGTNVNARGPAYWNGTDWISIVDGGTIA